MEGEGEEEVSEAAGWWEQRRREAVVVAVGRPRRHEEERVEEREERARSGGGDGLRRWRRSKAIGKSQTRSVTKERRTAHDREAEVLCASLSLSLSQV